MREVSKIGDDSIFPCGWAYTVMRGNEILRISRWQFCVSFCTNSLQRKYDKMDQENESVTLVQQPCWR